MRDWLIKLLGGVTRDDVGVEAFKNLSEFTKFFNTRLLKIEEQLEELSYQIAGIEVVNFDTGKAAMQPQKPIKLTPPSWQRVKKDLEKKDIEKYWRDKGAKIWKEGDKGA